MVSNEYTLPVRKARICRIAGAIFLILAALTTTHVLVAGFAPGPAFDCNDGPCRWTVRPARMLADDQRVVVMASPKVEGRFNAYVAKPIVRLALAGVTIVQMGPFAMLLVGVGAALRRLGGRSGDPLGTALPWLRFASLAALTDAVAAPLGSSLMESLLSLGMPEGGHWILAVNFNEIGIALMLGIAAYATVWALEAGLQAQRDLAEIV